MDLIKDLGKKKIGNHKRRIGLFQCKECGNQIERRIDIGRKQKTCGCQNNSVSIHDNIETKNCSKCKQEKHVTDFYIRSDTNTYRAECKDCHKERELIKKYGVCFTWYANKLEEQDNSCAICNKHVVSKHADKMCVDHNHKTNEVRGILCSNCNTALGLLKEDKETINNLLNYINHYN